MEGDIENVLNKSENMEEMDEMEGELHSQRMQAIIRDRAAGGEATVCARDMCRGLM